jgi:hypothetical protein
VEPKKGKAGHQNARVQKKKMKKSIEESVTYDPSASDAFIATMSQSSTSASSKATMLSRPNADREEALIPAETPKAPAPAVDPHDIFGPNCNEEKRLVLVRKKIAAFGEESYIEARIEAVKKGLPRPLKTRLTNQKSTLRLGRVPVKP